MLGELKKRGEHASHVGPVVGVVGLHYEEAAGHERVVHVDEQSGRQDAQESLSRVVIGLGVINVDLGDTGWSDISADKRLSVLDGEPDVVQPALIGPAGRVADDDG